MDVGLWGRFEHRASLFGSQEKGADGNFKLLESGGRTGRGM